MSCRRSVVGLASLALGITISSSFAVRYILLALRDHFTAPCVYVCAPALLGRQAGLVRTRRATPPPLFNPYTHDTSTHQPQKRVDFFSFLREGDGPKLVKRDAPLFPGDRLKGGQYISSCTSILATGCKPKYFEVRVFFPACLGFAKPRVGKNPEGGALLLFFV